MDREVSNVNRSLAEQDQRLSASGDQGQSAVEPRPRQVALQAHPHLDSYLLTFDYPSGMTLLVVRTGGLGVAQGDPPGPRRSVAEKLEHLFRTVSGPRGEYSLEEVATGIRERGGPTVSASYIWQLRKGVKDNPTKKHIEALADFFGVPASYFFDDDAAGRIEAELEMLAALRDAGVRRVAMRAVGLSPQSLEAIQTIIESVRQVEGLADPSAAHQAPRSRAETEDTSGGTDA